MVWDADPRVLSEALGELLVHMHRKFLPYYHKQIETHHVLSGISVLMITFLR